MTDRLLQGLRLIESGHYRGLGEAWLRKAGGDAATEIERLRKIEDAAKTWRKSLEDDSWAKDAIEDGACRPGMAELMKLVAQDRSRYSRSVQCRGKIMTVATKMHPMPKGHPVVPSHTPGPWVVPAGEGNEHVICEGSDPTKPGHILFVLTNPLGTSRVLDPNEMAANARLTAAATDLLEAAEMLEAAELCRGDCEECEGEGEPEACGTCFPAFDDARILRRIAIEKARGRLMTSTERHGE